MSSPSFYPYSDAITPKRRLSLTVDENTQSSFPIDTADNGEKRAYRKGCLLPFATLFV